MKNPIRPIALLTLFLLIFFSCKKDEYKNLNCSTINATYNITIKPILDANCTSVGCHNTGSANGDFTTYIGVHGKVTNGSFEKRVLNEKTMPTFGPLSFDDRKKIKCWIDNGAPNN